MPASGRRCARNYWGRRTCQSQLRYLVVQKIQSAGWSVHSAHGREYPALREAPDPIVYLAGAPGDIAPGSQRTHRCRFHPRPGHLCDEPARHRILKPALTCAASDDFSRELRPPVLFRGYSANIWRRRRPVTATCRHRRGPQRLQFNGKRRRFRRSLQGARLRRVERLQDVLWIVPGADAMRDHRKASAASSSIQSCPPYNVASWQNASDGFGNIFRACAEEPLQRLHPHLEEAFTGLVNKLEARRWQPSGPGHRRKHRSRHDGGALRLAAQPELWRPCSKLRQSHRWARCRRSGYHRGDRPGSRKSRTAAARSGRPALGLGWPLASAVAAIRSRRISPRPAGKRPNYPASIQDEAVGGWAFQRGLPRRGRSRRSEAMHRPVASSIPTLLISGTFDTLTSSPGPRPR